MLKFLEFKRSRIRGDWESKQDAGLRSITKARFGLIKGKLLNYLVPFLGEKTDVRSVPFAKWNHWQQWRMENHARGHERPKAITIQNEMGMIRECWKWGMENSLIVFSPKLPFHDENLITDDKVRRETWGTARMVLIRQACSWVVGRGNRATSRCSLGYLCRVSDALLPHQQRHEDWRGRGNCSVRTSSSTSAKTVRSTTSLRPQCRSTHPRRQVLVRSTPWGVNSPSGFGIAQSTSPRTTSFSAAWTEVSSPLGNSEKSSSRSSRSWERRNGLANAWSLIRSDTFMHQPAFRTERLSRRSAKTWA